MGVTISGSERAAMSDERAAPQNRDSSIEQAITIVASWARQERIVERVYFFGSRVCGDYRPDSDLEALRRFHTENRDGRFP